MTGSVFAVVYVLAVLLICFGIILFLKRHVLNKRPLPTAAQQAGLAAMQIFQTPEQHQAVEEVEFRKKDWKEEAKDGDDIESHLGKGRRPGPDQTDIP